MDLKDRVTGGFSPIVRLPRSIPAMLISVGIRRRTRIRSSDLDLAILISLFVQGLHIQCVRETIITVMSVLSLFIAISILGIPRARPRKVQDNARFRPINPHAVKCQ